MMSPLEPKRTGADLVQRSVHLSFPDRTERTTQGNGRQLKLEFLLFFSKEVWRAGTDFGFFALWFRSGVTKRNGCKQDLANLWSHRKGPKMCFSVLKLFKIELAFEEKRTQVLVWLRIQKHGLFWVFIWWIQNMCVSETTPTPRRTQAAALSWQHGVQLRKENSSDKNGRSNSC